jgi:DNA mismatch repair ATPase MutS
MRATGPCSPPSNNNNNNKNINNNDTKKNMIITGPNASGKTTIIKSCLFNIILSQQLGCGFYKEANLKMYDFIYSYINIPDTSARDSLFQAEARRCKLIIDNIQENSDKNHFCIFDELYSGTNPDEAIKSGNSLIKYMDKYSTVDFMLTTHFTKLCKQIEKIKNIRVNNYKMNVKLDNASSDFNYTYRLSPGISKIKGGKKILKDLNYPKFILDSINIK